MPGLPENFEPFADLPAENPAASGMPARASVQIAGKTFENLTPNEIGTFPRVYLGGKVPARPVDVRVNYPQLLAGDTVIVQAQDGGRLPGGRQSIEAKVDAARTINFVFEPGVEHGLYRVTLVKGADTKILDFWAGQPLPVRAD
jgi:hypothetical protein